MYITLLLLVVFFAVLAMTFREGMWGNAIMLFNVMTAAMLATNYFETLANWIERKDWGRSYVFLLDFLSLWAIFSVVLVVLRLATDKISRVKVRFKMPVEWSGGIFFSLWVAWLMVCFTAFSFHTAPLARNFLFGSFQPEPTSNMFFGLAPDRQWLGWMHTMSESGSLGRRSDGDPPGEHVFDPNADFVVRYGARRKQYEDLPDLRVNDAQYGELSK
jgi:colicin V production protein